MGILYASLLGNVSSDKGVILTSQDRKICTNNRVIQAAKEKIREGQDF